ncbi:MAG: PTS sugar transporter subunit IIA [candidate division KSB1 bacterium]|nr:PTS sugar transporter subunit IIA [candidate division KSB1 bacterium]
MKLTDILSNDQVILPLRNHEKDKIIEEMVDHLYRKKKIKNRDKILKAILDREQVMSTGVGDRVALPHGKAEGVKDVVVALGITDGDVDFHSIDNQPVRLIFMLIGPPDKAGPHLKALGYISGLMRQPEFRERLLQAKNVAEVMQVIQEMDEKYQNGN